MPFRCNSPKLYPVALIVSIWLVAYGCSAAIMDNDAPPEQQYAEGERLLSKDRYLEAVERFRILKSRHPYSKYAALASLRIGDAHYKEEAFIEAASAYKVFRDLYPKHEQSAYAQFKIGESHWNLMPSTIDRDLEPAQQAVDAYERLRREFPNSSEAKEAVARIAELNQKLADHEEYVGDFYFKRDLYQAAASRYGKLLDNYPNNPKREEHMYRLAYSLERTGNYQRAESLLDELDQNFPAKKSERSTLREKVKKGLEGKEE